MNTKVGEAVTEVVAAANAETQETVAAVVAAAAEQVDQAQENAQAIAEAAMATELGKRIEANEREISSCHANLSSIKLIMETLQTEMTELKTTLAASLTLQVAANNHPAPNAPALSAPAISEIATAAEQVATALPGNLSDSAVSIPNEPEKVVVKARKIFL